MGKRTEARKEERMKKAITGILVFIALIGFCMAGGEAREIKTQFINNILGILMFLGGIGLACLVNRRRG